MFRRVLSCVTLGLVTLVGLHGVQVGGAPPALAHAQLVSANPAAGEVLIESPERIELTFNEDLLDLADGTRVLVVDAGGVDHAAGPPVVEGSTVNASVADLRDGHYQARWRVISADGHPISGAVPFTVGDLAADAPIPQVGSPTGVESQPGPDAVSEPGAGTAPGQQEQPSWGRPVLVGAGGAAFALLLLGGWVLLRSRRRSGS